MEEVSPDELVDVAYGLFEVMLTTEIRTCGPDLFMLVEAGTDFEPLFTSIFLKFSEEYPELGEALVKRFGSENAIYQSICAGEGVIPSKTTRMYWIVQEAPGRCHRGRTGRKMAHLPPSRGCRCGLDHGQGCHLQERARHLGQGEHGKTQPRFAG